jgi:hypothetical protein
METNAQIVHNVRQLQEENDFFCLNVQFLAVLSMALQYSKVLNRNIFSVVRIRIGFNADPVPGFAFKVRDPAFV